jgi:hypothetical protein
MSDLIQFFDDVTVANIPANATHVAYYMDGDFENEQEMKARFPQAQMLSITTRGGDAVADSCDCEKGDMSVAQTEAWVLKRLNAGAYHPRPYASEDTWDNQGLLAALAKFADKILRWEAAFPGIGAKVRAGFAAHQYATGALDTNVCLPHFFDKAPPKPAHDTGIAVAQIKINTATGAPHIHHMPGTVKFAGDKHAYEFHGSLKGGNGGGTWSIKRGS